MDYGVWGGGVGVSIQSSVFLVYRSNVTGMRSLQAPPELRVVPIPAGCAAEVTFGAEIRCG